MVNIKEYLNKELDVNSLFNYTKSRIFTYLLSDPVIIKISEDKTKQLVKFGFAPTNPYKFKEFLGTWWLKNRLQYGITMAFNNMKKTVKI